MFGVPIELIKKGNPEYALRQKGKVAELALGYQGSTGALINMGALDMGIPEEDLPDIVSRWREANKRIRDLWYSMDNAAVQVITQGGSVGINGLLLAREYDYNQGTDCFTIQLPSGRKLYYVSPGIGENQWGNPSISYMGMDQKTKRWKRIETYGGCVWKRRDLILSATSMMRWSLTVPPGLMRTPCWTRWSTSCASPSRGPLICRSTLMAGWAHSSRKTK